MIERNDNQNCEIHDPQDRQFGARADTVHVYIVHAVKKRYFFRMIFLIPRY